MIAPGTSVAAAIQLVSAQLAAGGIDSHRLDARMLVEAATGLTREQIVLDQGRLLSAGETARLSALGERRLACEPVTRILGERSFYGRTFRVTPDTLDPRPETETLVELALEIVREEAVSGCPIRILDIGTGTGCVLLTLLSELGNARGLGTDVSAAALEVARLNAARLGVADRAAWQLARSLEGIADTFDLVVSNPPYIPSAEIARLQPEVRSFDPQQALDGGADGLDVVREIIVASANGMAGDRAWWVVEIGAGQAEAVLDLIGRYCGDLPAGRIRCRQDLGGHTRCVAWKPHL